MAKPLKLSEPALVSSACDEFPRRPRLVLLSISFFARRLDLEQSRARQQSVFSVGQAVSPVSPASGRFFHQLAGQVENLRAGRQPALSDAPNCLISSAVLVAAMPLSAAGGFACLARLRAFFSRLLSERCLLLLLLFAAYAQAGIWPSQFGPAQLVSAKTVKISDGSLWSEYGLQEAEQAQYESDTQKFTATAYRLQDSTSALGAFDWQRPSDAKPSELSQLAVQAGNRTMLAHANYLLILEGYKPQVGELGTLFQTLPKLDQSPLPALPGYLPTAGLVPNSQRYVVGPAGLAAFDSGIPAGVAAFHLGSEAQIGTYRAAGGELKLAIFNYPTPTIARERLAEMQKLPAAIAKRSGPLVAVILAPPNADDAERLISLVRYQAAISWDQYVPSRRDNIGDLVINAFIMIGVLLAFSTVAGLAFGGFRVLARRVRKEDRDAMTVLNLGNR